MDNKFIKRILLNTLAVNTDTVFIDKASLDSASNVITTFVNSPKENPDALVLRSWLAFAFHGFGQDLAPMRKHNFYAPLEDMYNYLLSRKLIREDTGDATTEGEILLRDVPEIIF